MPITPFLNGERFDQEMRRILCVALEMSCIALRVGDCADDVRQAVANKIMPLPRPVNAIPTCCAKRRCGTFVRLQQSSRVHFSKRDRREDKMKGLIAGGLIVLVGMWPISRLSNGATKTDMRTTRLQTGFASEQVEN
jgi:hypothetical protein